LYILGDSPEAVQELHITCPAVCIPCGHVAVCERCAKDCYARHHVECPLCRHELLGWFGPTMGELMLPPKSDPYWRKQKE
jgi:hypothetical protein